MQRTFLGKQMKIKHLLTEKDNETFCAIRVIGFMGVGLVAGAIFVGAAPLEVGAGIAAIITSIGGGIRLKGDGNNSLTPNDN